MSLTKTDKFIYEYCKQHAITLLIDPKLDKNDGLCYPDIKEINLAQKYSSSKIKLATFFHELGHIYAERFKDKPYSNFDCEFLSWWQAQKLHKKYFGKSFSKQQAEFMLKCLKTYCRSLQDFKKIIVNEDD